MVFGLWGMWANRRHWREHSIFYAQFIVFAAITALFFGHTSYRCHLDVYWIVFAAGVLAAWLSKSPFGKLVEPIEHPAAALRTDYLGGAQWLPNRVSVSALQLPPTRKWGTNHTLANNGSQCGGTG
jgi:hypothetical protein